MLLQEQNVRCTKSQDRGHAFSGLRGEDLPQKEKIKIIGSKEMMEHIYSNFQQFANPKEDRETFHSVKALPEEKEEEEKEK